MKRTPHAPTFLLALLALGTARAVCGAVVKLTTTPSASSARAICKSADT